MHGRPFSMGSMACHSGSRARRAMRRRSKARYWLTSSWVTLLFGGQWHPCLSQLGHSQHLQGFSVVTPQYLGPSSCLWSAGLAENIFKLPRAPAPASQEGDVGDYSLGISVRRECSVSAAANC
eukprot:XP_001707811.1 Hypothetical protein GL50803_19833 [Giardia lamblia ATCC 50803]